MTQQEFDCRFDRFVKTGFAVLIAGTALMIVVAVPAFAFFGVFWPFTASAVVAITGGIICVGTFAHDIFCNPRWRR